VPLVAVALILVGRAGLGLFRPAEDHVGPSVSAESVASFVVFLGRM
jgi:hypothetical protein